MNLSLAAILLAAFFTNQVFSRRLLKKSQEACRIGDGRSYSGTLSNSINGRRCLYWNRVVHEWGIQDGISIHRYCRNPDQSLKPWCFVRKGRRIVREFCDVPKCFTPTRKPFIKPTLTPPAIDTEYTCGEMKEQKLNKIVGGSFITIESQPWIAAIYRNGKRFLCGGSLISPCWVLTAMHCFHDGEEQNVGAEDLTVYLGRNAINDTDSTREQMFSVQRLILHQDFGNFNNDIALLKIKNGNGGCAAKSSSVRTVCLPPPNTRLPAGIKCKIAGYGKEKSGGAYSQLLKQAEVTLLPNTECNKTSDYKRLFTNNMFCAASPDWRADACQGDSGGPLVCEASNRMFLFGVVSWGNGCASENNPGVYTQVTNYNKWIANYTELPEFTKGLMYPQK